jgi:hypothetical protein
MDEGVAPSSPAAGAGTVYMDETSKNLCVKSSDGAVKCGVQVADPVTHMVVTGIAADGSVSQAQLSSANLSDSATLVKLSDAQIVSSKQLVPRVCTLSAASGTVTAPNADLCDVFERHDVSGTLDIPTPTATGLNPRSQQVLTFSLYAATAQSVTWSSAYAQGYGVALPTTIPATTYVAVSMRYNTTSAKYETWASTVDTVTTVAKGGTGVATLTGLAVGNGTSPFTGVTTSAGLAAVLSDEEGSTGGFVRAGGNVATATALAANPTPCTAGQFVTDIAADGTLTCGTPTGTGTMHLFVGAVKFPTSNAAILDSGGNYYKLGYDETTSWCAWWQIEVPKDYTGSPVFEGTVTPTGNSSGSLILDVSVMAVTPGDAAVLDTDSYDTTNTCTLASIPTTGGHPARISCALTSNDSMAAEDALRVKVCRNVSDTAATRMNLSYAVIQYAR